MFENLSRALGGKHDLLFRRFMSNMGGSPPYRPQVRRKSRLTGLHHHNPDTDSRRGAPRGRTFFKGR